MENNINNLSPLTLAFLGDAVYGLLARKRLVLEAPPINYISFRLRRLTPLLRQLRQSL